MSIWSDSGTSYSTIQDALDGLESTGGTLFIGPGTYLLTATLTIGSNINIEGFGEATVIKRDSTMTSGRLLENSDLVNGNENIKIRNLKFDGNNTEVTASDGMESVYFANSSNITVSDVSVYDSPSEAIQYHICEDSGVLNCYVEGTPLIGSSYKAGIILSGSDDNNQSKNCFISNCRTTNTAGEGIGSYYSKGTVLSGNVLRYVSGANRRGQIQIEQSEDVTCVANSVKSNYYGIVNLSSDRVTITGNTIQLASNDGVIVSGSSHSIVVGGNSINLTQKHGIRVQDTAGYVSLTGNRIVDVSQEADNTYDAIYLDPNGGAMRRIIITGNVALAEQTNKMRYVINTNADASNQILGFVDLGNGGQGYQSGFRNINSESDVTSGRYSFGNVGDSVLTAEVGSLTPDTDSSRALGTSSKRFSIFYGDEANISKTGNPLTLNNENTTPNSGDATQLASLDNGTIGTARGIFLVNGSPEGNVTAAPGSIALDYNGGSGSTLYIKESGTLATGWGAK